MICFLRMCSHKHSNILNGNKWENHVPISRNTIGVVNFQKEFKWTIDFFFAFFLSELENVKNKKVFKLPTKVNEMFFPCMYKVELNIMVTSDMFFFLYRVLLLDNLWNALVFYLLNMRAHVETPVIPKTIIYNLNNINIFSQLVYNFRIYTWYQSSLKLTNWEILLKIN